MRGVQTPDNSESLDHRQMDEHKLEIGGIDALHVPIRTQPNRENECLLYAMEMVLTYCSEVHPSSNVRDNTTLLTADDLKDDHVMIRDSGWAPSPDDIEALSEHLGVVNLDMNYWKRAPPDNGFESLVGGGLERRMPTIVVVDAKRIQGLDSTDGQHAIVITGMSKSHVSIANPWDRRQKTLKKEIVRDAWNTKLNRVITVEASEQQSLSNQQPITSKS